MNNGSQTIQRSLYITKARQEVYLKYVLDCQDLKRTPPNLRFNYVGSPLPKADIIPIIMKAEAAILNLAIKEKQAKLSILNHKVKSLSEIDKSLQTPVDPELLNKYELKFRKRVNHYKHLDGTIFKEWPSRQNQVAAKTSSKTLRNRRSKDKYKQRQIKKVADAALSNGKVLNLTDVTISDSAIAVLSYGDGFVPTSSKFDSLQLRQELQKTMVKVNGSAHHLEVDRPQAPSHEQEDDGILLFPNNKLPKKLQKHSVMMRHNICKDPVVNQVFDEVINFGETFQPKSKLADNLNKFEREGLKELKKLTQDQKIVICMADKGGMIIILPPDQVRAMINDHLEKAENFVCVGEADPLLNDGDVSRRYFDGWKTAIKEGYISTQHAKSVVGLIYHSDDKITKSTLDIYKPGTPYFYVQPKVHKFKSIEDIKPGVEIPSRLITSLCAGLTVRGDKFIAENFLGPLAKDYCTDRMQDTTDFLRTMENFVENSNSYSGFVVLMDIVSLYDNLTHKFVHEGLKDAIKSCRPDWKKDFISWLLDMIDGSLNATYAKYENRWYKMVDCVPTGHTLSVHLADIAVFSKYKSLIYSDTSIPLPLAVRFVDDGCMLWEGTIESFEQWVTPFKAKLKHECGLSVTHEIIPSKDFSAFLAVKFKIIDGALVTVVHHKPTDAHTFLHYNSCHRRSIFRSIVYSQGLRYRRIFNDDTLLDEGLKTLEGYFVDCGYPRDFVKQILDGVRKIPRSLEYKTKEDDMPFLVPFVQPYGPGSDELEHYINNSVDKILREAPVFNNVSKPIVKSVYSKGPSLRNILYRQKDISLGRGTGISSRCTTIEESKHKRGRKCQTCPLMANKNSVELNGTHYNLEGGNCKSRNVIYLAKCKICTCKPYIGKTDCPVHDRVNGHQTVKLGTGIDKTDE